MALECIEFRDYKKNTLSGFAVLKLTSVGLLIKECALHEKNGQQWVSWPARSFKKDDGSTGWVPLVQLDEKFKEAFQIQALKAINGFRKRN